MNRRIVCAAVKLDDDSIIVGVRHFSLDMRATMRKLYGPQYHTKVVEQGFIDNKGGFLSRKEAWEVAILENQIIRRTGGDGSELYSENLY